MQKILVTATLRGWRFTATSAVAQKKTSGIQPERFTAGAIKELGHEYQNATEMLSWVGQVKLKPVKTTERVSTNVQMFQTQWDKVSSGRGMSFNSTGTTAVTGRTDGETARSRDPLPATGIHYVPHNITQNHLTYESAFLRMVACVCYPTLD
jgi:hypothetical protein